MTRLVNPSRAVNQRFNAGEPSHPFVVIECVVVLADELPTQLIASIDERASGRLR